MSRSIRILLFSALTLVGLTGGLLATPVRFLPLNQEIAGMNLGVRDSNGTKTLQGLNPGKRTASYNCNTGGAPLHLVLPDLLDPDGKPESVEVPLDPAMKSPLVVILPDTAQPSGLRAVAVDEDSAGFPWGTLRFLNTTDLALMLRFGSDDVKPLAAANSTLDILPEGDARNVGVQLFKEDHEDEILYSAVWEHDPNIRKLIVLVSGADPSAIPLELVILPEDKRSK